jgi:hypothetical protein
MSFSAILTRRRIAIDAPQKVGAGDTAPRRRRQAPKTFTIQIHTSIHK